MSETANCDRGKCNGADDETLSILRPDHTSQRMKRWLSKASDIVAGHWRARNACYRRSSTARGRKPELMQPNSPPLPSPVRAWNSKPFRNRS